jgi:catechol 2,3-dioxygenase-like lactoylglutathione lyase family enzyme
MKILEIAFVCYPVTDLKRAEKFYAGTLGLKESRRFGDAGQAWIEYVIGPGTLAITNLAPDWKPSANGGGVGLEVDNFNDAVDQLKRSGASFRIEATETPVCHMAIVSDPDGNSISIHKRKP